jgi:riboflavin-specific deaminase-like protein
MQTTLSPETWARLLDLKRRVREPGGEPVAAGGQTGRQPGADETGLAAVYRDLVLAGTHQALTIAQIGQSLDGRIATETGHSQYINGSASLDHLHRLRALMDAVVVGATTVELDDPQLTTRRVAGESPTRVIIDPRCRLAATARVFDGTVPTLVFIDAAAGRPHPAATRGIPVIALDGTAGRLPPAAILQALRGRDLTRVLVEGGAHTVSAFLAAGCVDRLHVAVAPILIGSGVPAITLPPIARVGEALQLTMTAWPLGDDVLFDCRLLPAS